MADVFYCTTVLLELWFGLFLLFQLFHCNYYLADSVWLLSHHCFVSTMIWLISSLAPLFYWNYDLIDFFYCTTVLLQLWFGWLVLLHYCFIAIMICLSSSVARRVYCSYKLAAFLLCTTVYCKYDFADFIWLLSYHCFIAIIIWFFSSFAPLFYLADFFQDTSVLLRLSFSWFLQLHHGFIGITIWLISSIAALFNCNYHLVALFSSTTVFLRLRFGGFYLASITPLFYCNYDLVRFFCCTTVLLQL